MQINFFLNGVHYKICTNLNNITIQNILTYFCYQNKIFVLEYNQQIFYQTQWQTQKIINNDKIEIITIVGGG